MTTVTWTHSRRPPVYGFLGMPAGCWLAFIGSRLLVLASGVYGAVFTRPIRAWTSFDPHRLSSSLGAVGNVLAAPSFRWDAVWYVGTAEHGYTSKAQTVFFPLYPLMIRGLTPAVVSPVIAGVLISLVAFAIGLVLVHRITSEEIGSRTADATVLLLTLAPFSFVFSAVYTESLLLALSAGMFYLARRDRFVFAGMAAAAAALTHIQGVLLVAPLAVMYVRSRGGWRSPAVLRSPGVIGITLPPLALAGFFVYLHTRGWGWLAPITNQNVPGYGRSLVGPPITVFNSIKDVGLNLGWLLHKPPAAGHLLPAEIQNMLYLVTLLGAVLALVSTWRRLPPEYAVFAAIAMLVCTSSAAAAEPLQGFDRYMLPIFPLWIGAAAWLREQRLTRAALAMSTAVLIFSTVEFTRWTSFF